MPDWTKSMRQTYEYYIVDPGTWKDKSRINTVKSCTINPDAETETLGSATIDIAESVGEAYIRAYLKTIQNGITEKHPLGTFLVQTPSSSFNGKVRSVTMDAYTPLIELKENPPPIGYSLFKGANIMDAAYDLTMDYVRAPVVKPSCSTTLSTDFVANTNDTWVTYLTDLIANAKYEYGLDELGRVLFLPKQDMASLQPVCTFGDGDDSILHPDVSMDHDLYGVPNVVEVIYSNGKDSLYSRVVNDDANSPISTLNRGREIIRRVTDPSLSGNATQDEIDSYATQLLRDLSTLEYTITFTHGYRPLRLGDCVRLNYSRAGLNNIKAKVVSQSIKCVPGCPVTTKVRFTKKLWG